MSEIKELTPLQKTHRRLRQARAKVRLIVKRLKQIDNERVRLLKQLDTAEAAVVKAQIKHELLTEKTRVEREKTKLKGVGKKVVQRKAQ